MVGATGATGPTAYSHTREGYFNWLSKWRGLSGTMHSWTLKWPYLHELKIAPVGNNSSNDITRAYLEAEHRFVNDLKHGKPDATAAMQVLTEVNFPEGVRLMEKWG